MKSSRAFTGFGPSRLVPAAPFASLAGRRPGQFRARIRDKVPRQPGVYGLLDARGELFYVGKAKNLRARLLSYFRRRRTRKARHLARAACGIAWECAASEFAALLRELELIQRWQPRRNILGQPGRRRRTYLCLGRAPAPYVFLRKRPVVVACFGPVLSCPRARDAVRILNDWLRLRDCPQTIPMIFAEEAARVEVVPAAACLRHALGTCLGPCTAACSRPRYAEQVEAARSFLSGQAEPLFLEMERAMQQAAASLAFERAASLRDHLQSLRWLHRQLERLRLARTSFVYPVEGHDGATHWFLLERGRVVAIHPQPTTATEKKITAERIARVYSADRQEGGVLDLEEVDGVLLVAAWFRRHPEERLRALSSEEARALCLHQE